MGSCSFGHDLRQRGRLREAEEDEERSLDERDGEDVGEDHAVDGKRSDEAREGERAGPVGHEQEPLPIDAIDHHPGDEEEQRERQRLREADEPRLERRPGQREHEQWKRDAARPGADRGGHLPRPEEHEVAVPP